MSLQDHKLAGYEVNIKDLPDKITNSAAWLKERFDSRTDNEVPDSINGVIDALTAESGAAEVGAVAPSGVVLPPGADVTVQSMLEALKKYVDDKLIEIGAADMAKAEYDPDGRVLAAGGIAGYAAEKVAVEEFEEQTGEALAEITSQLANMATKEEVAIESGENENGAYTKWPDGTMICTKKVSFIGAVTSSTGSLYRSAALDMGDWPVPFISTPAVSAYISAEHTAWPAYANSAATSESAGTMYVLRAGSSNSGTYVFDITATGRWK